jgi:hypothetical protein
MAGFFDQGYNSPDPGLGTGNNAANDFAALNAANPGQFESPFKKKSRKETIDATQVNPNPAPAPAVVTAQDRPPPAISSAPALVKRITQNSNPATALVPGTQMNASEFALQAMKAAQPPAPPPTPASAPMPQLPPPPPMPPLPQPPNQIGGNRFGGNTFGGNTFGGNQFGGNQFGASAPHPAPSPNIPGTDIPRQAGPGALPMPYAPLTSMPPQNPRPPALPAQLLPNAGYFSGGPIRMMHGGYPQLAGLSGMPERHFASGGPDGNFVPGDGKGDGRSDHVKAMLSPGEFVMDAESTSLLGNGDSDAGARGMEAIRKEIREHKGKALAKGKFSPDAPSPKKLARIGMKAAS